MDRNVAQAEAAYRDAGDFETMARALSGWRSALHQRIDAAKVADAVETTATTAWAGGEASGEGTWRLRPEDYWRGIPARFRDAERYTVEREIKLSFGVERGYGAPADQTIKVREISTGALAWASD